MPALKRKPKFARRQSPDVGFRLRSIRRAAVNPYTGRPYTLVELAKLWRTEYTNLRNYEANRRETPHKFLILYSMLSGRPIDWILTGKGWPRSVRDTLKAT